jgi:hypothetical protein
MSDTAGYGALHAEQPSLLLQHMPSDVDSVPHSSAAPTGRYLSPSSDEWSRSHGSGAEKHSIPSAVNEDAGPGCGDRLATRLLSAFITADPFVTPLRARPTVGVVREHLLCSSLLFAALLLFAVLEALRLSSAPPVTVQTVLPSLPVTSDSLASVMALSSELPAIRRIEYACPLSDDAFDLWQTNFPPQVPMSHSDVRNNESMIANCTRGNAIGDPLVFHPLPTHRVRAPAGSPQPTIEEQFVELPLVSTPVQRAHGEQVTLLVEFHEPLQSNALYGHGVLMLLPYVNGPSAENALALQLQNNFALTYHPGEITVVQVELELIIDHTAVEEQRHSQRMRFSVLDRFPMASKNASAGPPLNLQLLLLRLSPTYTKFEVHQSAWLLPWLGSLGGALTAFLTALNVLNALWTTLRRSSLGRAVGRVGDACGGSGEGQQQHDGGGGEGEETTGCLQCQCGWLETRVARVVSHSWRNAEPMEKQW